MYLPDTSPMSVLAVLFDMCRLLPLLSRSLSTVPRCILGSVRLDCVLWMIRMQSGCAFFSGSQAAVVRRVRQDARKQRCDEISAGRLGGCLSVVQRPDNSRP